MPITTTPTTMRLMRPASVMAKRILGTQVPPGKWDLGLIRAANGRWLLGGAGPRILRDRLAHGIEQCLVVERLRKKVHRPRLHRAHGHRDVTVAGDEDHGDVMAGFLQDGVQLEAALAR